MPQQPASQSAAVSIIELQSVDSTNNYARHLVTEGLASHGTAIFAHEQTQGRGQMGKKWIAESGSNILLSVLVNPYPLELSQQFHISVSVAVSINRFFSGFAGSDTRIKWPNDLYWQDRKAGGVLIENVIGGPDWKWAIIGIGININETVFSPELKNPVSLKQITGKDFDPLELAKELSNTVITGFDLLVKEGFDPIYKSYLDHLYKKDELVRLKKDNRVFEARIKSVSPKGKLIVEHAFEEEFDFGEIEWLI